MIRRLMMVIVLGATVSGVTPNAPAEPGPAGDSRQAEKSERRREMERQREEQARARAETHEREQTRRREAERARDRARLQAEDGRRRAAARARIEQAERDRLARIDRGAHTPRHPGARPITPRSSRGPTLRTLRRNERASLGINRVPRAPSYRVHYDAGGVSGAYYLTTIDRLRYRLAPDDAPLAFDPLRPGRGVVDIPAGVWTVRIR